MTLATMPPPVEPSLADIKAHRCQRSLRYSIECNWKAAEPKEFISGWHIDAIAEHLEACQRREIRNLIINMPPRHMKSLGVAVHFPAWCWLQDPTEQFLFASYAHPLAMRDSVKCRRVVESARYQAIMQRLHPGFALVGDQNTKIRYENNFGGYRLCTSVDGSGTGEGGDIIVVDDPHNVRQSESEATRTATLSWWDETLQTRHNKPETGVFVVVQQRVHHNDLSGHIIEQEGILDAAKDTGDWDILCLPARYEGEQRSKTRITFTDPRTEDGEPLWPEQHDDARLAKLEKKMTEYARSAQLNQNPTPREGGVIKTAYLNQQSHRIARPHKNEILRSVLYWDKAGTDGGGCWTCGVIGHLLKGERKRYVFEEMARGQWSAAEREKKIKTISFDLAERWPGLKVWFEQEPGSGGKESAENTLAMLTGLAAHAERPTGDKVARAEPFAAAVENGFVYLVAGGYVEKYVEELGQFPLGKYADRVDASSGAFNKLNKRQRRKGVV